MNNVLKGTNSKIRLIGKIKGLADQSKSTRVRLLRSTSERQVWKYSYAKYIVGLDVRHHLLAYAFLRGTPYKVLEKSNRPGHKPNAASILQIVHAHVPDYQVRNGNWTVEKIEAWIAEGASDVVG